MSIPSRGLLAVATARARPAQKGALGEPGKRNSAHSKKVKLSSVSPCRQRAWLDIAQVVAGQAVDQRHPKTDVARGDLAKSEEEKCSRQGGDQGRTEFLHRVDDQGGAE